MKTRLMNNIGLKVLAFLAAGLLWLLVVNIDDPVTSATYQDVPVTVINQEVLAEEQQTFQIVDDTQTVDVTVTARRKILNRIQKEEEILKTLLDQDLRGLIVEAAKSALPNPNLPLYRKLLERGTRILFLNSGYPELDCPVAALDDREAGRCAARFLLEMGHRELGGLLKSDDGQGLLRYQGFITELREAGIRTEDDRFVWYDTGDIGRFDRMEQRILERLAGCSAVFCYNDSAAVEFMELLKKRGLRVPEDVSVISVDDTDLALYGDVGLTSVHHPKEELGKKAAEMMVSMLRKKGSGRDMPVPDCEFSVWLARRDSVRRLNK